MAKRSPRPEHFAPETKALNPNPVTTQTAFSWFGDAPGTLPSSLAQFRNGQKIVSWKDVGLLIRVLWGGVRVSVLRASNLISELWAGLGREQTGRTPTTTTF